MGGQVSNLLIAPLLRKSVPPAMLKTRVITALVLFASFLIVLFAFSAVYVAIAFGLLAAILGWEWAGLMRVDSGGRLLFALVILASCFAAFDTADISFIPLWMASAVFWTVIVPVWLWRGWPIAGNDFAGYLSGWLLIVPTWAAMVRLQDGHPWWLFVVMGIVWVADISAYFAGRAWGRHKLAPAISPGKTWEGVLGAIVGVSVYAFITAEIRGVSTLGRGYWLLFMVALAAISIVGDLFESMIKRQAGVKDSSRLLPGHGGFLDRLDSQTSVLPLAALVLMRVGW